MLQIKYIKANIGGVKEEKKQPVSISEISYFSFPVDFRTQMTISHHYSSNESLGVQKSGSSQQSAPIWAKSDHFTSAENLDIIRKNVNEYSDTANIVTTSDESSEAMRIFAASPPEPHFVHKRFSDHYSSNESLGVQKFRSRSNTNQSHKR